MSYDNWFEKFKEYDHSIGLSYDDVLLVPNYSEINSRMDVDLSTTLADSIRLKIPVMSAAMDTVTGPEMVRKMSELGGIGILHRFQDMRDRVSTARDCKSQGHSVGVAVGLNDDVFDVEELAEYCDIVALDVAHAHSQAALEMTSELRRALPRSVKLMVGNIATRFAAHDLIEAGADILKVGIGAGGACTTRLITGFGVPNVTAIHYVWKAVQEREVAGAVSIVADGGIKTSGDAAKAIAAGADCVMLGSLLAGTDSTPGYAVDGKKKFRGMSSHDAQRDNGNYRPDVMAEGVSMWVKYVGSTDGIVNGFVGGLRSAFSYAGVDNIEDFFEATQFIKVTSAGAAEARPYAVNLY